MGSMGFMCVSWDLRDLLCVVAANSAEELNDLPVTILKFGWGKEHTTDPALVFFHDENEDWHSTSKKTSQNKMRTAGCPLFQSSSGDSIGLHHFPLDPSQPEEPICRKGLGNCSFRRRFQVGLECRRDPADHRAGVVL